MSKRSLLGIAGIVAVATLLSKLMGLVRQVAIAAAFGVGPAVDAYNYAYVIPGFLLILLGGINGPFHSSIVSVISRRPREEASYIIETVNTLVSTLLLLVTIGLICFAEPITSLWQGLELTASGAITQRIAAEQLRIMAPMALLSGLIGIGFGALNASQQYWLPSISPLLSSLAVIIAIGVLAFQLGGSITDPQHALQGGRVLAWGTLAGAVLQWLCQIPAQAKAGMGGVRLRWDLQHPGVREIIGLMLPATLSSGLLYINVNVDLYFAAYIPQAAAALGYAQLLVQTPLGLLSNMILVPLMPVLSSLTDPSQRSELKERIRQGILITAITMLPLSGFIVALAPAIVQVVYQRGAFAQGASDLVSSILIGYGIGMFVYLGRDVLVRVFYALGDGDTPFRLSLLGVGLNAFFDYLCVDRFGAAGLAVATAGVNLISLLLLLALLYRKLGGFPLGQWSIPIGQISLISFGAGGCSWGVLQGMHAWLGEGFAQQCFALAVAGGSGMALFLILILPLRLPELESLKEQIYKKINRSAP